MRKLLLLTSMVTVFAAGSLGLTVIFTGQGTLTVNETVPPPTGIDLDVELESNLVVQKQVPVTNTGRMPTTVIVTAEVLDDAVGGPYAGVTVTPSEAVTVDPGQTVNVVITITASNGIRPGTGTVQLDVLRP